MKKITYIISLFLAFQVSSQTSEKVLADTIAFITENINTLESWRKNQEANRLNFDDCNLEIHQTNTLDDGYVIYAFWLLDLDEKQMELKYFELFGTWVLKLKTLGNKKRIQVSTGFPSGNSSELILYSDEKEPLIEIGKALYFAIRTCKELDRFKE